jgi:hypothetical protein
MSITIPEPLKQMRTEVPFDSVSVGYGSIHLWPVVELQAAQKGYGIIPEGGKTDWRDEWIVIGYEGLCGDPIFIATNDANFPVYTAAHGTGQWRPKLLAATFRHFIEILQRLQLLARGRATPAEMARHPITKKEEESFLAFIRAGSPDARLTFWETIYGTDM